MKAYRKPVSILVAIFGMAFTASVMAADVTNKAEYKQDLNTAEANYNSAHEACDSASGSERLACRRQAYANWGAAKADAREAHGLPRYAQGPRT
jgi:hypothetical protein